MDDSIDELKALKGKKIVDIKLEWDEVFEEYYIDSIIFEDGIVLGLVGKVDCVWWWIENVENEGHSSIG